MYDKNLVNILDNIAILLQIKGENPFKARAYSNAAAIIRENQIDVRGEVQEGTLGNLKGFGNAFVKKLTEYVQQGKISVYEKLISEIPESLVDITKIKSIGPGKTRLVYEKLGITTLAEFEKACKDGRLSNLKGFTQKTIDVIIENVSQKK